MNDDLIKRLRDDLFAETAKNHEYCPSMDPNDYGDCIYCGCSAGHINHALVAVKQSDRIEQLERERDEARAGNYAANEYEPVGHDAWEAADRIEELEAKLAKAVEALRKIAAYTHSGPYGQGITQHAEARIARTVLAELRAKE